MLITGGISDLGKLEDLWEYCAMPKSRALAAMCEGLRVGIRVLRVCMGLRFTVSVAP